MLVPIEGDGGDKDNEVAVTVLKGKAELKKKMISVFKALCEADLEEAVKLFHDRVIVPAIGDFSKVLEHEQIGKNTYQCNFKPMIELLLLELESIATRPGLTDEMRKKAVAEAMKMAGF